MLLRLRLSPHALKEFTDNADATDLFFHGFNFVLLLGIGFTTDCICAYTALDYLQQEIIREKIKSVASALSVNLIERVRTEPKAKEHNNVVLSSRQPISACL